MTEKIMLLAYLRPDIYPFRKRHRTYKYIQRRTSSQGKLLKSGYEMYEVCRVLLVARDVARENVKTKVEKAVAKRGRCRRWEVRHPRKWMILRSRMDHGRLSKVTIHFVIRDKD